MSKRPEEKELAEVILALDGSIYIHSVILEVVAEMLGREGLSISEKELLEEIETSTRISTQVLDNIKETADVLLKVMTCRMN